MKRFSIFALCAGGLWLTACEECHRTAYYDSGCHTYGYYGRPAYRYGYSGYYRPGYRYSYYRSEYPGYRYGYYSPGYTQYSDSGEPYRYRRIEPIGERTTTYRTYRYNPTYWDTGDARARSTEFLGMP